MNHKRGRPRNSRAGCKLCKPWKANGVRTERADGEAFSDHTRREAAAMQARMALIATEPENNHDEFCVCAICIDQLDEPAPVPQKTYWQALENHWLYSRTNCNG